MECDSKTVVIGILPPLQGTLMVACSGGGGGDGCEEVNSLEEGGDIFCITPTEGITPSDAPVSYPDGQKSFNDSRFYMYF